MDFVRYAERSAALLNAALPDEAALLEHLADRGWLHAQVTSRDVTALRKFQAELRPVFEASGRGEAPDVVAGLNALLERHPVTPMISDHEPGHLHMLVANRAASVAELLISESLMGLANLVCEQGPERFGTCGAEWCDRVFVDTSPNRSRRYCSERCSSRANVAAYRARQRAGPP